MILKNDVLIKMSQDGRLDGRPDTGVETPVSTAVKSRSAGKSALQIRGRVAVFLIRTVEQSSILDGEFTV